MIHESNLIVLGEGRNRDRVILEIFLGDSLSNASDPCGQTREMHKVLRIVISAETLPA